MRNFISRANAFLSTIKWLTSTLCLGLIVFSTKVESQTINMQNGATATCSGNFYDSGSSAGNYVDYETYIYTIFPTTLGGKVQVIFSSFSTEANYDGLVIYNGNSSNSPIISSGLAVGSNPTTAPAGSFHGTTSPGTVTSTAADGALTFIFRSDVSNVSTGWAATVNCVGGGVTSAVCLGGTLNLGTLVEYTLPTGGILTTIGNDRIHTFTSSGVFTNLQATNARALVVAGGGGGGNRHAGGAGAGGLIYNTSFPANGTLTVTVGNGGTGATGSINGTNGQNSVLGLLTVIGGGGGGTNGLAGSAGGSGGGGSNGSAAGAGTVGQGNAGGSHAACCFAYGSGGGGAGAAGANSSGNAGSGGGVGVSVSITGTSIVYAGGGGGGCDCASSYAGGNGGGGAGGRNSSLTGTSATANTGGGGGGGGANGNSSGNGGNGGSGIVVVRYTVPAWSSSNTGVATVNASGVVTPVSVGTATITYVNSIGASLTKVVKVESPTIAGPTSLCVGGNITLTSPLGSTTTYNSFTSNGSIVIPQAVTAEVLVVAGGGGGGSRHGGGGGGGGVVYNNALAMAAGTYAVTVGAGGGGGNYNGNVSYGGNVIGAGGQGGNSSIGALVTATGGGGGKTYSGGNGDGGSGGGGTGTSTGPSAATYRTGGSGTTGQGYAGGTGSTDYQSSGGGGGAGGVGGNVSPALTGASAGGAGGLGFVSSITGSAVYYGGGGGGGGISTSDGGPRLGGVGGNGGGGHGGDNGTTTNQTAGTTNTGGGGGGCRSFSSETGSAGGSGIVIIKYTIMETAGTWSSSNSSIANVNSSTGVVTGVAAGSTQINYTSASGCIVSVTITVNQPSVAPTSIVAPASVCAGNSVTLSLSGGTAGTGATTEWYTGSCAGTSIGTGSSITHTPSSATTYYARYNGTCNTTSCASATVTTDQSSVAPTGVTGTTTICSGENNNLTVSGGTAGTGATAQWFTGSCGGASAGSGNTINVSPTSTTTYYVRYSGTCNTTACTTTTLNVNQLSVAPTSITGTNAVCLGSSTTLTSSGGSLGTNAVDLWYMGTCADAFDQTFNTQPYSSYQTIQNSLVNGIVNVTSTGNDPMLYMETLGSFDPATYRYVNIRYRVTSGNAGGVEIFFYNAAHAFAVGGETGYATLVSDGNWNTVSVDMQADPDYLTGGNITGWRYDWATNGGVTMDIDFISLSASPIIGSGSSITVSPTTATTYYTYKKGSCNRTTCASQPVTINQPSVAPTGVSGTSTICNGGNTNVSVSGGTAGTGATTQWFTGSCSGTPAGTGNSINVSPTSTTTYYVRYSGTCNTTTCGMATVTVNSAPAAFTPSVVTATPLCVRSNAQIQIASSLSGITYQLRDNTTNVAASQVGNAGTLTFLTNPLVSTNANYNVVASVGTCSTTVSVASIAVTPIPVGYASNNDTRTCYVNTNNYVEFVSANGVMLSINSNGQNLGNVTVTEYAGSPVNVQACGTTQPWYITAALGRHWAVQPQFQPSSAVSVRLYYDNSDYTALTTVANANANPNDDMNALGSLDLSKYSNAGNPSVINGTFTDNCSGGNSTVYTPTLTGSVNGLNDLSGFVSTGRYSQFSFTGFSELWLSGTNNVSPLPIELISFTATCDQGKVMLDWVTATEINNEKFIVERSANLQDWETINIISGAGNSNQTLHYSLADGRPVSGLVYYKLTQKDYDGKSETFEPISIICFSGDVNTMTVYPNPADNRYTVALNMGDAAENAKLEIMDMTGKLVETKHVVLIKGTNEFLFDSNQLQPGQYIIQVRQADCNIAPIKLIIR